jgi:UDP-N-acetyl-D-glucosamine/UDP-N-acetyl-D-galactosamine dehydrogenase
MFDLKDARIGIIGLGYVGLPLAVELGKHYPTRGLDINAPRVAELQDGKDSTLEVDADELKTATLLTYTSNPCDLEDCNVFIVTVPTPIDGANRPDLSPLEGASHTVGKLLSKGDVAIFESTVYPGATEEICVPIMEAESGLVFNQDFYAGYSPERINPGDKEHRVTNILKVTAGSTPEVADYVDALYGSIITAGTHKASSIKVAEASKVIENTQRDVNIGLINELALIFDRIGIDTEEVLEAAGTKWNFLPFRPGLVGGHCIGVDPYYLVHKAQETGYQPMIIPASRLLNDGMGEYVADCTIRLMAKKGISIVNGRVLILGLSFKENCPDLRNTRVVDIIARLTEYHGNIDVYDPWVHKDEAKAEYGIDLIDTPQENTYDAVLIAVAHDEFKNMGAAAVHALGKSNHIVYDAKYLFTKEDVDGRL